MQKNDYEKTYRSLDNDLAAFFNASQADVSDTDLRYAYPIQSDLLAMDKQYVEHEVIGVGGIKKIIRVTDVKTDRSVAKAVPLKESGKESVEAFLREARLTSSLQHPNIIPIYDMGLEEDGTPYFVMEQFTGETLGDILKEMATGNSTDKLKYSRSALLDIFASICNAVAYAHSRQIIHLDLKPDNIHVNSYGQVHVCDWGLGKILTDDTEPERDVEQDLSQLDPNIINSMTLNGEIKGTPGFMAPEQARGEAEKNKSTDIYALGALLYNILSFKLPVSGISAEELIRKTREGIVDELPDEAGVPDSLRSIVLKALQKDPAERYESVEKLTEDLDRYRHGFPTKAENAGFFLQVKLLVKRHKTISLFLLLFSLFSLCGGLLSYQRITNEMNMALEAKLVAENALDLYMQERQLTEEQGNDIDQLLYEIASREDLTKPLQQIDLLEQGLERNISDKYRETFLAKLSILHFVMQNFEESEKSLLQIEDNNRRPKLLRAIKRFGHLKQPGKLLKDQELAQLINYLSHHQRFIIPFMFHQHMRRTKELNRKPTEYWPLAKAMLMMINNYWNTEPLDRELIALDKGYSLDLSRTRYREYRCYDKSFSVSVLAPLKLRKLNLSHTPFFEFWQLNGIKLASIDLTGCWVREIHLQNLDALINMGLKEITIDGSLYTEDSLSALKEKFTVIDVSQK